MDWIGVVADQISPSGDRLIQNRPACMYVRVLHWTIHSSPTISHSSCLQGWADGLRNQHGTYPGYWCSSGTCSVLDAAMEEVLFSDVVYTTRVAVRLLETYRAVFPSSGGLVQAVNRGIGSRPEGVKIVLLVNAWHLRWANYVADASIACYQVQSH
jgi:hypothetical protein